MSIHRVFAIVFLLALLVPAVALVQIPNTNVPPIRIQVGISIESGASSLSPGVDPAGGFRK